LTLLLFALYAALSPLRQEPEAEKLDGSSIPLASSTPPPPAKDEVSAEHSFDSQRLVRRIEQTAQSQPGTYGMVVYDPRSGKSVFRNPEERFYAASLNKLTVLATLYRDAARGKVDLGEKISIQPSDVESYGTGILHTYSTGRTMTLQECASYLIKYSDNTARAMFERLLGIDRIEKSLEDLGAQDTIYYRRNLTSPQDVMSVLKHISDPGYTSPRLSREMLSIMTDTEYENRLPAPLPEGVRVAHKIGSWENTTPGWYSTRTRTGTPVATS